MPISAGPFAGSGGAAKIGKNGFEITDEQGNAFWLGAPRQKPLFEIQIKGQGTGEIKRQQRRISSREILFGARDGQQVRVQLNRARSVCLRRRSRFVVDHENFGLQEGAFLADTQQFETLAAFGYQIESTVWILLYDGDDFGGASHVGETLLNRSHYAEVTVLGQAFANHFLVTRLEDVQGQGSAGEQDNIEREQG